MRQSPSARDRRCQGAPAAGGWLECSGRVLVTSGWQRCVPAGVVRRSREKKNQGDMFVEIRINGFLGSRQLVGTGGGAATASGGVHRAVHAVHVAGGHQTFSGRRQVHTPARVRSGAAGRGPVRPQKIAQPARTAFAG